MKAVAAGDEIALDLVRLAIGAIGHARPGAENVVQGDVIGRVDRRRADGRAAVHEILGDFGLPVDHDGLAGQRLEVDAVAHALHADLRAIVHEAVAVHTGADPGLVEEIDRDLLDHAGAEDAQRVHQVPFRQGCRCLTNRDVITAKPDTPLGDVARLLERNRIKRVPIVEGAKLVGIVSRANILQALASAAKKLPSLTTTDNFELRKKVVSRLASEPWRPTMLTVTVQNGTVDLWGLVHSVEQKKAAQLAAETTPGVRAVDNNIVVQRVGSGWS